MEMYIDQYRWNKGVRNGALSFFGEVENARGFQKDMNCINIFAFAAWLDCVAVGNESNHCFS